MLQHGHGEMNVTFLWHNAFAINYNLQFCLYLDATHFMIDTKNACDIFSIASVIAGSYSSNR